MAQRRLSAVTRERRTRSATAVAPAPRQPAPEPQAAGRIPNHDALRALGIRAKLAVSQPSDPDEHEADRLADAFVSGRSRGEVTSGGVSGSPDRLQRACASCDEEAPVQRKEAGGGAVARPRFGTTGGQALPRATRAPYERFFNTSLSHVRVHDDPAAHQAARAVNAHAFTHGQNIYFAPGRFDPGSSGGQRLLAHELTHTVQRSGTPDARAVQRQGDTLPPTAEADRAATAIVQGIRDNDLDAVVGGLEHRSIGELQSIRTLVLNGAGVALEQWLAQRLRDIEDRSTRRTVVGVLFGPALAAPGADAAEARSSATAELGLRRLWPALPLIERMLVYDEGFREIEEAQVDVVRAVTAEQRTAARSDPRLQAIYGRLGAREAYDVAVLIDGPLPAAERALRDGDEDVVFDAVLALPPTERREFVRANEVALYRLLYLWQLELVRSMAREIRLDGVAVGGNEVDALIARLRLATSGRIDDIEAVQRVVDRAVALLQERQQLRALSRSSGVPAEERERAEARLRELAGLDRLFTFERNADGELAGNTFMGLLAAARGEGAAFAADAARLAPYGEPLAARQLALRIGVQRIVMAGSDLEGVRAALYETHAPAVVPEPGATRDQIAAAQHAADVALRRDIMADDNVRGVLRGLTGFERSLVEGAATGDRFEEVLYQMNMARNAPRWGEFFALTLQVARNDDFRRAYQRTATDPFGVYAGIHGEAREIMLAILEPPYQLPLARVFAFTGNVETLRAALGAMPEAQRAQLRRGWSLARHPVMGPLTASDSAALAAFRSFTAGAEASQTNVLTGRDDAGLEAVLTAAFGAEPTEEELASPSGRYDAAALMYERQEARLALDRGGAAHFTESDETMVAAAREFGARWLEVRDREPRELTTIEYSVFYELHQRFTSRADEYEAASDAIGEMAAMIASTVAGVIVVIGTGGVATPGVIAAAAAAGAGARVITREMMGGDYFNATDEGARQAMLGAIDGALAVVSGRLATRAVELMGLSGRALGTGAARVAGAAAEAGGTSLGRRSLVGGVEAAIDGLLSGSITEAFGAFTDERTWRRGIAQGLARVGQAALAGGLTGLATGGVIGGVAPVLGAGARGIWRGIVGDSVERTLADAGASEALAAARAAAGRGDMDAAMRAASDLEPHLNEQQVLALRQQLYDEFRAVHGHPPGTARAATPDQEALLLASGRLDDGLSDAQRQAEIDIVRRSSPQPSSEAGYIDQVDLGNGHTWRRQADGTWCRFSRRTLCGTDIPSTAHQPIGSPAEIAAARLRLRDAAALSDTLSGWMSNPRALLARMRQAAPEGTLDPDLLTGVEHDVLTRLFPGRHVDDLTPAEVLAAMRPPTAPRFGPAGTPFEGRHVPTRTDPHSAADRVLADFNTVLDAAQDRVRTLSNPLYQQMRAVSPGSIGTRIRDAARGIDQVSGAPARSGRLAADHIVPLIDIVNMDGFAALARLDRDAARDICNFGDNLHAMDFNINSSRGSSSWSDPFNGRQHYTRPQIEDMIERENGLRPRIQEMISEALRNARSRGL